MSDFPDVLLQKEQKAKTHPIYVLICAFHFHYMYKYVIKMKVIVTISMLIFKEYFRNRMQNNEIEK